MYTQCPDCAVAFRVTADVLRQAAGKVRCGGCGTAFNAIDHLSEGMPEAPAEAEPDEQLPELTADKPGNADLPQSISAEQSAALLKTLDELAGEDIRIEDTGVEWRVLDDSDVDDDVETDEGADDAGLSETGSLKFVLQDADADGELEDTGINELDDDASTGVHEQMRFDDNTPLPDDFDLDAEPARAPAEAEDATPADAAAAEEPQSELALGDPDEWQDLLGEVDDADAAAETEADDEIGVADDGETDTADEDVNDVEAQVDRDAPDDVPPDMDTQFAIQAEAMGIDISGVHAQPDDEAADDAASATAADEPGPVEAEADDEEPWLDEAEIAAVIDADEHSDGELSLDEELMAAAFEAEAAQTAAAETIEAPAEAEPQAEDEPELSEEELTINRMIDQDLLAIAVEDDDGFTSTIVQKQLSDADDIPEEKQYSLPKQSAAALFETIVMEGDSVKAKLGDDPVELAENDIGLTDAKPPITSRTSDNVPIRGGRRRTDPPGYGTIAAAIALALALLLQVMHHSREALATVPLFETTVAPLYRMAGLPVTPAWNISGWRFEATRGSTDDADEVLTIYSRVGNKSDQLLPYPLIHVSLTDRFEEVIGSKVLEPASYLVGNADPRRPVRPGTTFNAVISIASPSAEATGFKLNVCYRQSTGELRCAIEDFK